MNNTHISKAMARGKTNTFSQRTYSFYRKSKELLLPFILFSFTCLGAQSLPNPPGTKRANDSMYIDRSFISCINIAEYLHSSDIQSPDIQTMYEKQCSSSESDKVILLSREQQEIYCSWRSARVNERIVSPEQNACNQKYWKKFDFPAFYGVRVRYRPLTISEYTMLSRKEQRRNGYLLIEEGQVHQKFKCVAMYFRE